MNKKSKNVLRFLISFVLMFSMLVSNLLISNVFASGVLGDVNGDGEVTYKDVTILLNYVRNNEFTNASKYDFTNTDMDGDNMITATDVSKLALGAKADASLDVATLYVFGDSTGCDYAASADPTYYYKRVGFGTRLGDYFDSNLTIKNYALSGRSSKSFVTDAGGGMAYYESYLQNVKKGDYVIIAFGHNDEKAEDAARYTEPLGDKDTAGSFKNSLYANYIKPALDAGATPILCTPTVRRSEKTGVWSDSNLHKANGGDYAQCIRDLGSELGLTVIDNTNNTKDLYDKIGAENSIKLHAWTSSKATSVDNTHLNNYGASWVAYMMANDLQNSNNPLGKYVNTVILEPTEAKLIVNPDYKEKVQTELTKSELWQTTDPWWGTVFGDMGGDGKIKATDTDGNVIPGQIAINPSTGKQYYAIDEVGSGSALSFHIDANSGNGKIAGSSDGMAAVFRTVSSGTNFAISAVANVNAVTNTNNQVSFGAIILDNIDVDKYEKTSYNYIAAGPLKMADAAKTATDENPNPCFWGGFGRIEGTLTAGSKVTGDDRLDKLPKAGDKIPVKITKVGNKYTIEYNGYVSELQADFSDDVYVGFFAVRNADVTFTDIVFNNEVTEN